ncbi:S4 domain-containing protein [Crenobacter sp. SG2305]|uniref:pseudouridine synthase n=1 Tax=Crenobacter oryzisoli TaxID=3056844 RepID=UPI0025AB126E|nr:S4 domain-containing protein [Crenobacter sp. SG2305]MDN0082974.1 S4 domain-containing protein [Crenobacter sp. SG2305]
MSDDTIRLSKRMTELGLCSRREADEFIEMGLVKVDGVVVNVLGSRVRPDQTIELTRQALAQQAERVTVLLNKPVGYVCGPAGPGERPAWQLIKPETRSRVDRSGYTFLKKHTHNLAPAGQLEVDSDGLLVLTQDGRIARKLIADVADYEQEWLVWVDGGLSEAVLAQLAAGVEINGVLAKPAKVSRQSDTQLRFTLRDNTPRLLRRLCDAAGLHVAQVKRIRIGRIALGNLDVGQWRYLEPHERF